MHSLLRQIDPGSRATQSREPVSLRRLLPSASFVGCADIRVIGATEYADKCAPGTLFVPKPAALANNEAIANQAIRNGASALLVARPVVGLPVSQCVVPEVARAYGEICATLAGRPMRNVRSVGIAGTRGAETVSWLIRSVLVHAGQSCGLMSDIETTDGIDAVPPNTIEPDAKAFWNWMARTSRQGTSHAAIDLSSDAFDADWIANAELEVAGITRLVRGDRDDHRRYERDLAASVRLLGLPRPGGTLLLNQDDPATNLLRSRIPSHIDVVTLGLKSPATFMASQIVATPEGTRFVISIRERRMELLTRLRGNDNILNCLMAAAAVDALGFAPEEVVAGLEAANTVARDREEETEK